MAIHRKMYLRVLKLLLIGIGVSCYLSPSATAQIHQPSGEEIKSVARDRSVPETSNTDLPSDTSGGTISRELHSLFQRLDQLGRNVAKDAKFVELEFGDAEHPNEEVWLVSETDDSITVLKDDLLPWTYRRKGGTPMPASWQPTTMYLWSIEDSDFEKICRDLSQPRDRAVLMMGRHGGFDQPGPSYRLLIAHAACKKGLTTYCEPIISSDPMYKDDFKQYEAAVFEDLSWLSFLRGVNLLMFADRAEVVPHLRLAAELSPKSEIGIQSKDLLDDLEKFIAADKKPEMAIDESKLSVEELADLWVSQIKDIRCSQFAQPGFIIPYGGVVVGKADEKLPTLKLRELGMDAVPALIKALEDDTPTRTVYHWRDFHRSRLVWRVSDFAWHILLDITQREFGNRPVVGFTLSSLNAPQKRRVIEEIKDWYAVNKDLSADDRMFEMFSSHDSDDWITAGNYFLEQKNNKAVKPLLEKILRQESYVTGDLCELVARFRDPVAKDVIRQVMTTTDDHSDRLSAAIALWALGDNSGIQIGIEYATAKEPPHGGWDVPIWFVMRIKSKEAMKSLEDLVKESQPNRAAEIVYCITNSFMGDMSGEPREAAGCVEICPVLIAAMDRPDDSGGTINGIKIRVKDVAAKAFVLLRDGTDDPFPDAHSGVNPKVFNESEPDEAIRDRQIRALIDWYDTNKSKLSWDDKRQKLLVLE